MCKLICHPSARNESDVSKCEIALILIFVKNDYSSDFEILSENDILMFIFFRLNGYFRLLEQIFM